MTTARDLEMTTARDLFYCLPANWIPQIGDSGPKLTGHRHWPLDASLSHDRASCFRWNWLASYMYRWEQVYHTCTYRDVWCLSLRHIMIWEDVMQGGHWMVIWEPRPGPPFVPIVYISTGEKNAFMEMIKCERILRPGPIQFFIHGMELLWTYSVVYAVA